MSKKRDRIRRQLEAYALLAERCAVCRWPKYAARFNKRICLHHIVGRRGLDPHDHRNLLPICEECHALYHDGGSRPLTLGHILQAKLEEDGEVDVAFLAKLRGRAGLREDPTPLPPWVHDERESNERIRSSIPPGAIERG